MPDHLSDALNPDPLKVKSIIESQKYNTMYYCIVYKKSYIIVYNKVSPVAIAVADLVCCE